MICPECGATVTKITVSDLIPVNQNYVWMESGWKEDGQPDITETPGTCDENNVTTESGHLMLQCDKCGMDVTM